MRRFHLGILAFSALAFQNPLQAESAFTPTQGSPMESQSSSRPSTPSSPLDAARPGYNPNVFNPAMGLILDAVAGDTRSRRGFMEFRSAELNLMAAVDPFANLYAVINGNDDGLDVEEAAFMTTSLPWNLTARGGRFFANFGRLPHWHPHEYPFVNPVESIESFIGGEAQGDGAELIHLFKTPFFLQGTLGAYNKIGAENDRLNELDPATGALDMAGHSGGRPWDANTYLQRLFTNVEFTDLANIDIGVSNAVTPRQYYVGGIRQDAANPRWLTGVDLTFRYEPTGANQVGRLLWGTEIFRNDERRRQELALDTDADDIGDTDTFDRRHAMGGYSYVDWRFAPRFSTGGFFDLAQNLDTRRSNTNTYGILLNFLPSEFQRIRLQLSQVKVNDGSKADNQIFIQWFGTIGTHVHVFKDR
jgi:hypothetical protein